MYKNFQNGFNTWYTYNDNTYRLIEEENVAKLIIPAVGFAETDVDVYFNDDVLEVVGEIKNEEVAEYGFTRSSFEYKFTVNSGYNIEGYTVVNGIVTVFLIKTEKEKERRKVKRLGN